jgi:hypothetical protein
MGPFILHLKERPGPLFELLRVKVKNSKAKITWKRSQQELFRDVKSETRLERILKSPEYEVADRLFNFQIFSGDYAPGAVLTQKDKSWKELIIQIELKYSTTVRDYIQHDREIQAIMIGMRNSSPYSMANGLFFRAT